MRFRFARLILVVVLLCGFAASQSLDMAEMIHSFGHVSNGDLKARVDNLLSALLDDSNSRGLVVINGDPKQIAARRTLIQKHIAFRKFDATRITFRIGGRVSEFRSELWVIPKGSDPPKVNPEAFILDQFGVIKRADLKRRIEGFHKAINKSQSAGYIINYGTDREIAMAEKGILSFSISRGCDFDCPRVTFVRGGKVRKRSTVIWIVPEGAKNPEP